MGDDNEDNSVTDRMEEGGVTCDDRTKSAKVFNHGNLFRPCFYYRFSTFKTIFSTLVCYIGCFVLEKIFLNWSNLVQNDSFFHSLSNNTKFDQFKKNFLHYETPYPLLYHISRKWFWLTETWVEIHSWRRRHEHKVLNLESCIVWVNFVTRK